MVSPLPYLPSPLTSDWPGLIDNKTVQFSFPLLKRLTCATREAAFFFSLVLSSSFLPPLSWSSGAERQMIWPHSLAPSSSVSPFQPLPNIPQGFFFFLNPPSPSTSKEQGYEQGNQCSSSSSSPSSITSKRLSLSSFNHHL